MDLLACCSVCLICMKRVVVSEWVAVSRWSSVTLVVYGWM